MEKIKSTQIIVEKSNFSNQENSFFYTLAELYKKTTGTTLELDFLLNAEAHILVNKNKEVLGGFFTALDGDLVADKNILDFKNSKFIKNGLYITGLVIDEHFKDDVSVMKFMEVKIKEFKRKGFAPWAVVSDEWIKNKYIERGYVVEKISGENGLYLVIF